MKKDLFKKVLLWITYAMLLFFLLLNIKSVFKVIGTVADVLSPIFIGILLAYVLNFVYMFFRNKCFKKVKTKKGKQTPAKALSLICTYVIALGVISFLMGTLIPQLVISGKSLVESIPDYLDSFKTSFDSFVKWVNDTFRYNLYDVETLKAVVSKLSVAVTGTEFTSWITDVVKSAFPIVLSFSTGIYNWLVGIVVSIYLLASKEVILRQLRKFIVAFTPKKFYVSFFNICTISNKKFGKFLMGQIVDSALIGVLCFIGLSILRIEYPLLISVLVGVTNVIPFFGPYIGGIPSAILLLIINPWHCLWFVIFIVCLQQLDGNVIYPRIVGESVGIQGFWIIFSVILGGGLFGIPGMILGVPVFATVYTVIQKNTASRLESKQLIGKDFSESKDFVSSDYLKNENAEVVKKTSFNLFSRKKASDDDDVKNTDASPQNESSEQKNK